MELLGHVIGDRVTNPKLPRCFSRFLFSITSALDSRDSSASSEPRIIGVVLFIDVEPSRVVQVGLRLLGFCPAVSAQRLDLIHI